MTLNNATESHSKRMMYIAIAIVGMMFFIFGFVSWVNAILIPYFRIACELTNFQSYLVTFAFSTPPITPNPHQLPLPSALPALPPAS